MNEDNHHLKDQASRQLLAQLISGTAATHLVFATAKLGIADILADGPKNSTTIAEVCGAHPRGLYRMLRALTTLGVFEEIDKDLFALTPTAELLRSDAPTTMRWWAMLEGQPWSTTVWSNILHTVATNESAFDHVFGMDVFEFYQRNPESAEIFNRTMTGFSAQEAEAVVASFDFSHYKTVVDVGGGHGLLLSAILRACPGIQGTLFDVQSVAEGAEKEMSEDIRSRCRVVSGDFFQEVPAGGNLYLMKSILHDWNDERSSLILANIRRAISPGGTLLVVERHLPETGEPSPGKLFDFMMLIWGGGLERTRPEYEALLSRNGFRLEKVIDTGSPLRIYKAVA